MNSVPLSHDRLGQAHIQDIQLAASKLHSVDRRAFQAAMAIKYCEGSARLSETVFGWGRQTVALGLAENRTGLICVGAQSGFCGGKRWETKYPDAAAALHQLAEAHAQQDPTFNSTIAYTRLTGAAAIKQLHVQGFSEAQLPSPSSMAVILNRMGYRLRKVVKAKPQKKSPKPTPSSRTSKPKTAHRSPAR